MVNTCYNFLMASNPPCGADNTDRRLRFVVVELVGLDSSYVVAEGDDVHMEHHTYHEEVDTLGVLLDALVWEEVR